MKFFTVKEAEAFIPTLEGIFEAVAELSAQAEVKAAALRKLAEDDSDPAAAAIDRAQLQFLAAGINEWMRKIAELGALPKGVQPALVDFPHHLEGREVYLCWRLGDKKITHYHGMDEGFADRKPLPRARR